MGSNSTKKSVIRHHVTAGCHPNKEAVNNYGSLPRRSVSRPMYDNSLQRKKSVSVQEVDPAVNSSLPPPVPPRSTTPESTYHTLLPPDCGLVPPPVPPLPKDSQGSFPSVPPNDPNKRRNRFFYIKDQDGHCTMYTLPARECEDTSHVLGTSIGSMY